jgi:hypothetical protein
MATGKYNTTKHDVPAENFKNPIKDDAYPEMTEEQKKKLEQEMKDLEQAFTKAVRKAMKG